MSSFCSKRSRYFVAKICLNILLICISKTLIFIIFVFFFCFALSISKYILMIIIAI